MDEVLPSLVVLCCLHEKELPNTHRCEPHRNELHRRLLDLLTLCFADSLHLDEFLHRCHGHLHVIPPFHPYGFNSVIASFLELFDVTGVDAGPFQLLYGGRSVILDFGGKLDVLTSRSISISSRCSCMVNGLDE